MPVMNYKGVLYHKTEAGYTIIRDGPRKKNYRTLADLKAAVNAWEHKQISRDKPHTMRFKNQKR